MSAKKNGLKESKECAITSAKLEDMVRGWFIGSFEPSLFKTEVFEVGVQKYKKGERSPKHVHHHCEEFTVIASGRVAMSNKEYGEGAIITVPAGVPTDFHALEDTTTVVVKIPGIPGDKEIVE